nr:Succinate dehydrogenase subunit 4 [Polysiphonia sp.]
MLFRFLHNFSIILWTLCLIIDWELSFIYTNLILFHFWNGLNSIIKDYIHQIEINLLLLFFNRIFFLSILNILLEFFY